MQRTDQLVHLGGDLIERGGLAATAAVGGQVDRDAPKAVV